MKNWFKYLMLLVVAIVTSAPLVSCGDDEDDLLDGGGNGSVLGTWQYVGDDLNDNLGEIWGDEDYTEEDYTVFKEDGTYYSILIEHRRTGDKVDVDKGTYRISGNKMSTTYAGITATATFSVSGNTMKTVFMGLETRFKKVSYNKVSKYIEEFERNH